MKEEEGPTIDLLCIVKIIPAIISISPIIIRYFPIFFGRCTVLVSLHKIRVFVILRYGIVYKKNFAQKVILIYSGELLIKSPFTV